MEEIRPGVQKTAIELKGLTKTFGTHSVLKGIDLEIARGQTVFIFGPNGAGKTTLIKILATIINPTKGEVFIDGLDIKKDVEEARRKIGIVTHQTYLYNNLTVFENLDFYGRMYDVPSRKERIREMLEMVDMADRIHDKADTLSRGMQQRVSIARALLHKPGIILLDEPETGLDQQSSVMLRETISKEKELERTIIQTTHSMNAINETCDRVLIIARGKIAWEQCGSEINIDDVRQAYRETTGAQK